MASVPYRPSRLIVTLLVLSSRLLCVTCSRHYRLFGFGMLDSLNDYLQGFEDHVAPSDCKSDVLLVMEKAREEEWALKMFDAWAKPQTGILTGNSIHLGNFDECISIEYRQNGSNIQGQYCSAFIEPNNPDIIDLLINNLHGTPTNPSGKKSGLVNILDKFRLSWGICVPHSCKRQNLEEIWRFSKNHFNVTWDVEIKSEFCDYKEKHEVSDFAYFTLFLLSLCVCIVVVGTVYHFVVGDKKVHLIGTSNGKWNVLREFSAYTNCRKILNGKSRDPLRCLNAVRVLSLFWIIVRHYFMLIFYFPHINGMDINEWKGEYGNMFILSGSMAVDSFFTASGVTVAYMYLKSRETDDNFNVINYYLHKLIRVMPTLVLVVLIYASLLTYLGNGPFWHIIYHFFQRDCENNWWSTLLFVANYVHPTGHCLTQGWYLSVDLQLFFLSPFLLLPLTRWPKPTIIATILITIASMVQCFVESWTMNLGSTHFDENVHYHANIVATHIRAPSWLIGFILGYILYRYKDEPINLKKPTVVLLWTITIVTFLIIILGHESVANNEYHIVRSSIFNTLVRPTWSIAMCWVIFAAVKGYGGIATKVLHAPIFNIIIKINFNMFLLHVLPQIFFIGQTRMSTYFSTIHNMYLVLADLAGALLLAFIWTLMIEPWVVVMERNLLPQHENKEPKICTLSLLKKENGEKLNDSDYATTEIDLMDDERTKIKRDSP